MDVQRVDRQTAAQTIALLAELRVSLFGVNSARLYTALVGDALGQAVDGRVAVDSNEVRGVVLAAPMSYWRRALLRHWGLTIECLRARAAAGAARASNQTDSAVAAVLRPETPPRSWNNPGDAWRIIIVGTDPSARGRGIAAQLYRSVMADRSLVARVALDNTASIRLHHSLGWQMYRDGDVALAVHLLDR